MDPKLAARFLRDTQVVASPRKILAAYGATRIHYHLVSPVDEMAGVSRLREGSVVSEKPLILTPESLRERFEGFGDEGREFAQWLCEQYKDLLRALEYRFKNQDFRARVMREDPRALAARIKDDLESRGVPHTVLMTCPDAAWSLALMKFTLDESARAFPEHVRSFDEHGLFDPGGNAARRRSAGIEALFAKASSDASARAELGRVLKDSGLLSEYEDRFLSLF